MSFSVRTCLRFGNDYWWILHVMNGETCFCVPLLFQTFLWIEHPIFGQLQVRHCDLKFLCVLFSLLKSLFIGFLGLHPSQVAQIPLKGFIYLISNAPYKLVHLITCMFTKPSKLHHIQDLYNKDTSLLQGFCFILSVFHTWNIFSKYTSVNKSCLLVINRGRRLYNITCWQQASLNTMHGL